MDALDFALADAFTFAFALGCVLDLDFGAAFFLGAAFFFAGVFFTAAFFFSGALLVDVFAFFVVALEDVVFFVVDFFAGVFAFAFAAIH